VAKELSLASLGMTSASLAIQPVTTSTATSRSDSSPAPHSSGTASAPPADRSSR
jgi:hypothetical protein